ncbi:MAG TPA: amidase family protein, partial [Pirellulaceae bacterium]|nr:amidase family protein [Pirellulaceae bacterium]
LLNAVVVRRFGEALKEAAAADAQLAAGFTPTRSVSEGAPLVGVPITIKECFHLAGTPCTIGIDSSERQEIFQHEAVLVRRLKQAGAVILGKTNVPQLMIWHECDNPVYGRTNNPWDLDRTCGGSTGGEAAIVAAGGSPLGLGNDLGGSIRVPCHFCGIHGLKPTSYRLPRGGVTVALRGFESLVTQPGPMARHVEDLWLAMQVLAEDSDGYVAGDVVPAKLPDPHEVRIDQLTIAVLPDDGVFPASPAIQRAVRESADALRERGAKIVELAPADFGGSLSLEEVFDMYCGFIGADGAADCRRFLQGSTVDWRVWRMVTLASLWSLSRWALALGLKLGGQRWMARLLEVARPLSADEFWQLTHRKTAYVASVISGLKARGIDAILCPPHALPAMQHTKGFDLLAAASYAYLFNLLSFPAGVVSLTRVRSDEEDSRPDSRDRVLQEAREVDLGSAGLPVGVQVAGLPWREDIVLAVMSALERSFCEKPDYPCNIAVPTSKN